MSTLEQEQYVAEMRERCGLAAPNEEGTVVYDRQSQLLRIVNFNKEVWRGTIKQPRQRSHQTLIEAFAAAGFQTHDFRRGFEHAAAAEMLGLTLPHRPCTKGQCRCSTETRAKLEADQDPAFPVKPGDLCGWVQIRNFEGLHELLWMRPDAWLVLPDVPMLVIVEVDITHHPKPDRYNDLWDCLDFWSWSVSEIHVDRHGNIFAPYDHAGTWLNAIWNRGKATDGDDDGDDDEVTTVTDDTNDTPKPPPGTFTWRGKTRPL